MERRRQPAPLAGPAVQELLLTELASDFPELVLRCTACPSAELDADGAYRSLSGTGRVPDEANESVVLRDRRQAGLGPVRISRSMRRVGGTAVRPRAARRVPLGAGRGATIRSARRRRCGWTETKSLIRLRGQWVALIPNSCAAGWSFWSVSRPAARLLPRSALAASHPDDVDTPPEVTATR